MAKTILNVKMDSEIKEEARKIAAAMGIPLSTIVNAQLRRFVSERRIEFDAPLIPNAKTRRELDAMLRNLRKGDKKDFLGPFTDAKAARRALEPPSK